MSYVSLTVHYLGRVGNRTEQHVGPIQFFFEDSNTRVSGSPHEQQPPTQEQKIHLYYKKYDGNNQQHIGDCEALLFRIDELIKLKLGVNIDEWSSFPSALGLPPAPALICHGTFPVLISPTDFSQMSHLRLIVIRETSRVFTARFERGPAPLTSPVRLKIIEAEKEPLRDARGAL